MLRGLGVHVIEYENDYSKAVAEAAARPRPIQLAFIDDENSKDLFLGYTVAALRLKSSWNRCRLQLTKRIRCLFISRAAWAAGPAVLHSASRASMGMRRIVFAEPTHSPVCCLNV
ncbi:MAG: hypothetical protein ACLVJ6_11830 [Merdibacter sp.]